MRPILILIACALILVFAFSAHVFPITTDSLIYISTAQNIKEGHGLVFDNIFVQPPEPDTLALKLHPPGYSILIAFFSLLGVNAYTAALILPRVFFLLLPMGLFLVFNQMMPKNLSVVTAGLCTFMFPCLQCALIAWADIPFLFLSLMSFFFIFKAVRTPGREQFIYALISGAVTGGAILVRNVGYALVLSIGLGLILFYFLRAVSFSRFLKIISSYIIGFLTLFAPYAIRNFVVFGQFNPYRLPPANVTLTENLSDYIRALSQMILINPSYGPVLCILIAGMLLWFMAAGKQLIKTDKPAVFCAAVLMIYFFTGSLLVILSKTLYFGPERINERYLIQYAWIVLAGLSYGVHALLLRLKDKGPVDIKGVTILMLLVFLLLQVFPAADFYFQQKKVFNIAKRVKSYVFLLKQIPEDSVIVSNVMDMTYFYLRRNVKMLNGYTPYGLTELLGGKKNFAVFILKEQSDDFKPYLYPPSWIGPEGYRAIYTDNYATLWLPK